MIDDFNMLFDSTFKPDIAKGRRQTVKCEPCGRFISDADIREQKAHFHFIPDSQFGPEESYWECRECHGKA